MNMWDDETRACWQLKDFHNVIENARCIWRKHHNGAKIFFSKKMPAASKRPPERPQDSDDDAVEVVNASSSSTMPANVGSLPPGLQLEDLNPMQKKASCACWLCVCSAAMLPDGAIHAIMLLNIETR